MPVAPSWARGLENGFGGPHAQGQGGKKSRGCGVLQVGWGTWGGAGGMGSTGVIRVGCGTLVRYGWDVSHWDGVGWMQDMGVLWLGCGIPGWCGWDVGHRMVQVGCGTWNSGMGVTGWCR